MNFRHQQFINEYLICWNATEAYRRVYPNSSGEAARRSASELLTNPDISAAIQQRIDERAMTADEVLVRLADQARGDVKDFLSTRNDGMPLFDYQGALDQGKTHLLKKVKTKTKSYLSKGDEDTLVTETDVEFELYDAQSALVHIGKHHGLFVDKSEVTGKLFVKGYDRFSPDDWDNDTEN
jgi:phage terminase small subunit